MKTWSKLLAACCAVCACAAYSRVGGGGGGGGGRVFRPGASLRPAWAPPPRYVQAASNRAPYVLYKSPHNRYMKPHFSNKFGGYVAGPWRASVRLPAAGASPHASSPAYEFVRAAPPPPLRVDGPIYTMPAPNLSLADRPIVVVDSQGDQATRTANLTSNKTKAYEVTEKTVDPLNLGVGSKFVAPPSGPQGFTFSRAPSLASPELLQLVRGQPQQFQLSDTYPLPLLPPPQLLRHPALAPQLTLQGFNAIMQPGPGTEPNILQQNILFKPEPNYFQKISHQLYQRFPGAEFIQYPVETNSPAPLFIVAEDEKKEGSEHINVVRATDESAVSTLVPEVKSSTDQETTTVKNDASSLTPTEVPSLNATHLETTTVKLDTVTEARKDDSIFYPQIGENVGSIIANGFYSALTDVRAAEALASLENSEKEASAQNKTEETTVAPDLKPYFTQNTIKEEDNKTEEVFTPLHGVPFTKAEEPMNNVAYSFLRSEGDTKSVITKEGVRYAGQIVEASITDDDDFNHEKAALRRRPPLRLHSHSSFETSEKPKKSEVKPKSKPSRSKLGYDDRTGEPVIRIYASNYEPNSKSSEEHDSVTKKLNRHEVSRGTHKVRSSTPGNFDGWKSSSVKSMDRVPSGSDINQVTQFGLKLRPRMDDYTSIFEEKKK